MTTQDIPQVSRYDRFELAFAGPSGGNPFVDVRLSVRFEQQGRAFETQGF